MKKILIMGLPGSGKTTLAKALKEYLESEEVFGTTRLIKVDWFNADAIREEYNDWDFSYEGRIRQAIRMDSLAQKSKADYVIADFVAPLNTMRTLFRPDWTIWVDTIVKGRFEDTNKLFEQPKQYDFRVIEQDSEKWAASIGDSIILVSK